MSRKFIPVEESFARWGKDPDYTKEYDALEEEFTRAQLVIGARAHADLIVLGGGLSNIARLYASVPALWAPHVFSDRVDTSLVRASHGDASGVRGAAWLWENGSLPSSR